MKKTVKDIMTAPVITTTINATTAKVREVMERKQVNAIPIVRIMEGEKVQIEGIVTTSDLRGITDETTPVDLIMSSHIESVEKDASISVAAKKMVEKDMHHLIVMDDDRVVGIISSMDFVKMKA